MVKIGLQVKAQMEACTGLEPEGEDFRWYLKLRCGNCGDVADHWQYITLLESHPLKGGRGEASCVLKCKLCARENSIDILKVNIPHNFVFLVKGDNWLIFGPWSFSSITISHINSFCGIVK
jgi:hypothetical protein